MIAIIRKQCIDLYNRDCEELKIFLTRFDGNKGIVKCKHTEKDNTINLLNSIKEISNSKVEIKTVGTSGTIKALIRKHMSN